MSLADVRSTFETLGSTDPLWTVLTYKRLKHNRWSPEDFFATGQEEIRQVLDRAAVLGLEVRRARALDFGCAVGRLTQALCGHFDEVVGVDIAESFLDLARQYNRHGPRCRYLHNPRGDLGLLESGSFDFVYSNITLQHIPPEHSARYIEEFFRVLRPGGAAVFQVPAGWSPFDGTLSWCLRRVRWTVLAPAKRWWKRLRGVPLIGMYSLPCDKVEELVRRSQGRLADVVENMAAGRGWRSFLYYAVKG